MILRKNAFCMFGFALALPFLSSAQTPAPATSAPAVSTPAATPASTEPDYPDPRGFTIGVHYWMITPKQGIGIRGGQESTTNRVLNGLGKYKPTPYFTMSIPVTRTGMIVADGFQVKGSGSQTLGQDVGIFTDSYTKATFVTSNFQITNVRVGYDDLFFPHKFPISRFRIKSLLAFNYTAIRVQVSDPVKVAAVTATPSNDLRHITVPTVGTALEYAPAKHALLRIDGSGFGIPGHHSIVWESNATLSIRHRKLEFVAGAKAFHYKVATNKQSYTIGTMIGAFAGLRWHF